MGERRGKRMSRKGGTYLRRQLEIRSRLKVCEVDFDLFEDSVTEATEELGSGVGRLGLGEEVLFVGRGRGEREVRAKRSAFDAGQRYIVHGKGKEESKEAKKGREYE